MSTYLVTGAAGFIASRVSEMLLAEGHTVVGVDNLNDYYDVRLKDHRLARLLDQTPASPGASAKGSVFASGPATRSHRSGRFHFHYLDIEHLPALDTVFGTYRFDAVINLAARAGVRSSIAHPHVYLSTNTLGTLNLLECQRKHGVKKQVLASSSSLYSGCPMPFNESQPVNTPQSPYAATKKAAELLAYTYHQLFGLDITVLRYFTVFGPAGRPDMAPLRFVKWIAEGTPLTLFGDGTQSRDFTYIDDIARGTLLAVRPLGYEVINLGGGRNPISLQTIIGWMEAALGQKATIVGQPLHAADIKETWADITKAKRLLDWSPLVAPEEGFRRTVEWYRANRSWLRDLEF
jgi:UDP-glucuronate 4-epimerase